MHAKQMAYLIQCIAMHDQVTATSNSSQISITYDSDPPWLSLKKLGYVLSIFDVPHYKSMGKSPMGEEMFTLRCHSKL